MSSIITIQLDSSCIKNVPLQTYEKDFTFLVNGEEFKTSRLISDLLSPKICKIHIIDPTFDLFCINTTYRGHFSYILDLINFKLNSIPKNELPFISEVIENLENETITLDEGENSQKLTKDNVFSEIKKHEEFPKFYFKRLQKEIEFISSHFNEFCENQNDELTSLQHDTLKSILTNSKLFLTDEDQLLDFVNELYNRDEKFATFYEYVYFERVTSSCINKFIDVFNVNDITNLTWHRLSNRLKQDIKSTIKDDQKRYKTQSRGKLLPFTNNNEFDGIINYLLTKSGKNIDKEIQFTFSSCGHSNNQWSDIRYITLFNDQSKGFWTKDEKNSWICLYFKNCSIIPTAYTIKTNGSPYLKSWVIEVCNDNSSWEIIDEQKNCSYLNGEYLTHTFKINKQNLHEIRYIRILQTQTWGSSNFLGINSFEIFGTII